MAVAAAFHSLRAVPAKDMPAPVKHCDSANNVMKPATLETGKIIQVPLFIKEGERVKVHTETREFAGRAG